MRGQEMLLRENPYDFVNEDSKGKSKPKKRANKNPKKKSDAN